MQIRIGIWAALGLLLAALPARAERPVVLELFTSQGCSSCPPADALLAELAREPGIIALSYHINYWDYLGWKDPFSSQENSNRQIAYSRALRDSVYTPQLVVDGRFAVIGSRESKVRSSIAAARKGQVVVPIALRRLPKTLSVQLAAPRDATPHASIWAVYYRKQASTPVTAGENNGHTLVNINNVLKLVRLGGWEDSGGQYEAPLPETVEDGLVILLQEDDSMKILGAAEA